MTVNSRCVKFEINEYDKSLNKINDSEWRSWIHLMAPRIFCLLFIYITLSKSEVELFFPKTLINF